MEWVLSILLAALVLVAMMTVVGHGIWVAIAWIFRGPSRRPEAAPPAPTRPVWPVETPAFQTADGVRDPDEWAVTADCMKELFREGSIDSMTFRLLDVAIHNHTARGSRRPPPLPVQQIQPVQPVQPVEAPEVFSTAPEPSAPVEAAHPLPPPLPAYADPATQPDAPWRPVSPPAAPPAPAPAPLPPAKPVGQVLASFMERKNIRWGELVGGLLIVGCSVALVLSFWAEIAQRPLMKFSIFTAVTAALFALGLYSEHRWKLPTTSRGILLIATLLVPLNFLAFAAFARGAPRADPVAVGGELVAFALFLWLVWASARVIAPQWPLLLTAALMAISVALLAVRYLAAANDVPAALAPGRALLLVAAVVACYEAAGAGLLWKSKRWESIDADGANAVLLLLGTLSFAAIFPLALILTRAPGGTIHLVAPPLALAGLPAVAAGLLLWRRVREAALVRLRVAGTAVAVLGAAVLLGGIALAWPDPGELLPTAAAAFAAFLAVALLLRVPAAHVPAAACAAFAYLLGFHVIAGHVGWRGDSGRSLAALALPSGGAALAGLVVLCHVAAALFRRVGRSADASAYLGAALVVALVSAVLLVGGAVVGTGSVAVAASVFALYAAAWLAWSLVDGSAFWFNASQIAAACSASAGAIAFSGWRLGVPPPALFAEPAAWKGAFVALAALSLAWVAVRNILGRSPAGEASTPATESTVRLSNARKLSALPLSFDFGCAVSLAALLGSAALGGAISGVDAECLAAARRTDFGMLSATSGPLPWLALFLLVVTGFLESRRARWSAGAVLCVGWIACPLFACAWSWPAAGASALRWSAAAFLIIASAPRFVRTGRTSSAGSATAGTAGLDRLTLLLGGVPVALLSLFAAVGALAGAAATAPATGTFFARVGPGINYAGPLLIAAGTLAAWAALRRSTAYALAASLCTNLLVTTVYATAFAGASTGFDWVRLVRPVQLNIATSAGFSLAWLAALEWDAFRRGRPAHPPRPLAGTIWAALGLNVLLVVPAAGALFLLPASSPPTEAGGFWGWMALGISSAAALALLAAGRGRVSLAAAGAALPMLAAMAALTASAWDHGQWLGFHVWMAGQSAAAWAILGLGWWLQRHGWSDSVALDVLLTPPPTHNSTEPAPREPSAAPVAAYAPTLAYQTPSAQAPPPAAGPGASSVRWASLLGLWAVVLALRAVFGDPAGPWPSVAVFVGVALLFAAASVWRHVPRLLYACGALLCGAATTTYLFEYQKLRGNTLLGLIEVNAAALALPAIAWLVVDLHVFRRGRDPLRRLAELPFHRFAAWTSAALLALVVAAGVVAAVSGSALGTDPRLDWVAFAAVVALGVGCLWDEADAGAPALLYVMGLLGAVKILCLWRLQAYDFLWSLGLVLAAYGLMVAGLYAGRDALAGASSAVGLPAVRRPLAGKSFSRPWSRVIALNLLLSAGVIALAFWADFAFNNEPAKRIALCFAAAAQVLALAVFAWGAAGWVARSLRSGAIIAGALGALALGWAVLEPAADPAGLKHAASAAALLTLAAWAALAAGSRVGRASGGLSEVEPAAATGGRAGWSAALAGVSPLLTAGALVALTTTLAIEGVGEVNSARVEAPAWAIAAAAASFLVASTVAVWLALRPPVAAPTEGPRPPGRGRSALVYAAELLLAALFVHLRLTVPQLFQGYFRQYWPLILMAVAFAGVGVGEALRRRRVEVLAEPLQRTGALVPLLPVLAWWLASSQVHYTALLALVGVLYGAMAVLRRSTGFGLLAALAGNAGLWYLLHGSGAFGFLAHPQLWVIPAAVSVLAAVELNRPALTAPQVRAARYACLVAVYVSSTSDIFINGSAHSPWLPLVLAALSVAGVFAGVSFRVRPFLFLGAAFLALAVLAMIYNASASLHVTWIWYVAGILLGLFIICLFALFEKKRSTMLALVEGLREWD